MDYNMPCAVNDIETQFPSVKCRKPDFSRICVVLSVIGLLHLPTKIKFDKLWTFLLLFLAHYTVIALNSRMALQTIQFPSRCAGLHVLLILAFSPMSGTDFASFIHMPSNTVRSDLIVFSA